MRVIDARTCAAVALQDTPPIKSSSLAPVQDVSAPADRSEPNAPESDGLQPDEGQLILDIKNQPKPTPGDEIAYQACITEQEAARLRNEILVCRRLQDDVGVSGFNKASWERKYAQRTQGLKTPNADGLAAGPVYRTDGSSVIITVKTKMGAPPPPALLIDVTALPQAPAGSDADRIAKGLLSLSGN